MAESDSRKVKVDANVSLGSLWVTGWLFTIGYVGLSVWQGVLAIILWPYFLGVELAPEPANAPAVVERPAP